MPAPAFSNIIVIGYKETPMRYLITFTSFRIIPEITVDITDEPIPKITATEGLGTAWRRQNNVLIVNITLNPLRR